MPDGPSVAVVAPTHLRSDELFSPTSPYNRDDCLRGFRLLADGITARGGECHTQDVFMRLGTSPDVVLHLDIPKAPDDPTLTLWRHRAERWVFLQESEVIIPWNWDPSRHAPFSKVFTWHDRWVDGVRYHKLNHHVPFDAAGGGWETRPGQAVVVAGNKKVRHPLELYSRRLEAVRWADRHRPGALDLYGVGWNRRILPGRVLRRLAGNTWLSRVSARPPAAYRGPVERKQEVLTRYRFSLCLENARDIPGYITEKIFDVMLAGAVPVYLGADNVTEHIPANCFIDLRSFTSWSRLWAHLDSVDEARFAEIQRNGRLFLEQERARAWSSEGFATALMGHLL